MFLKVNNLKNWNLKKFLAQMISNTEKLGEKLMFAFSLRFNHWWMRWMPPGKSMNRVAIERKYSITILLY